MEEHDLEKISALVEEVREILEFGFPKKASGKSKNAKNPFRWLKKGKKLGPGPRKRVHRPAKYWACKCRQYSCKCTGRKGEKKVVNIDKGYKGTYNKQYRAWRKKPAQRKRFKYGAKGSPFMARGKKK